MEKAKPAVPQWVDVDRLSSRLAMGLRPGFATLILDAQADDDEEPARSALPDAVLVSVSLQDQYLMLPDVDRSTPMLVYCRSPDQHLSSSVANGLVKNGYRHVWIMRGGLDAWTVRRPAVILRKPSIHMRIDRWMSVPIPLQ